MSKGCSEPAGLLLCTRYHVAWNLIAFLMEEVREAVGTHLIMFIATLKYSS